jgi:hypothetical protein
MHTRLQYISEQIDQLDQRIQSLEENNPDDVQEIHQQLDALITELQEKDHTITFELQKVNLKLESLSTLASCILRKQKSLQKDLLEREENIKTSKFGLVSKAVMIGTVIFNVVSVIGAGIYVYCPSVANTLTDYLNEHISFG